MTFAVTASAQPQLHREVDRLCEEALERWQAPGLAIAIVKDDRVYFLKGYGVRKLGTVDPVTPDTIFPLASCTKSFTTLTAGILVDDGKLKWDDPLRKYLDEFELNDQYATHHASLRDVFCHRVGLAEHTPLWYFAPWSLEERVRKLRRLPLDHPFRSQFDYQTILFGAGGMAVGKAAGTSWQDAVMSRLLKPLGLKRTTPTAKGILDDADLASPHRKPVGGELEICKRYPLKDADPAGSIHSCARDLAQYLRFQLGDGTWKGQRLLTSESLREPHHATMPVRREGFAKVMNPDTWQITYGLGWIRQDYRGMGILLHGGAIDGFRSQITLVPEARLGIALLNNLDGTFMNLALTQSILDRFAGLPPRGWNDYYLKIRHQEEEGEKTRREQLAREKKQGKPASLPLHAYAGTYFDSAYGTCEVILAQGKLTWRWGKVDCVLEHLDRDTFLANNTFVRDARITFRRGRSGRVVDLFVFERRFRRQ